MANTGRMIYESKLDGHSIKLYAGANFFFVRIDGKDRVQGYSIQDVEDQTELYLSKLGGN